MENRVSTKLFGDIRDRLANQKDGPRLIAGLSLLLEEHQRLQERLAEAELQRAMAQFDRDCLMQEKIEIEEALAADEGWEDDNKELVERLIAEGIPRNMKVKAIKFVREITGWSLVDSKNWVEEHYFQRD